MKLLALFFLLLVAAMAAARSVRNVKDAKCSQPIDTGSDYGKTETRYAYLKNRDKCVPVEYGVCGGKAPFFGTENECKKACLHK